MSEVSQRVRRLRKARHLSQAGLARAIDRSPAHLSLIERGASPTIADVLALAAALGVPPSELLGGVLDSPAAR